MNLANHDFRKEAMRCSCFDVSKRFDAKNYRFHQINDNKGRKELLIMDSKASVDKYVTEASAGQKTRGLGNYTPILGEIRSIIS